MTIPTQSEIDLYNKVSRFFDRCYLNPQYKKKTYKEHTDILGIKGNQVVLFQTKGETKTSLDNMTASLESMDVYASKSKIPTDLTKNAVVIESRIMEIVDDAKSQSISSLKRHKNKIVIYEDSSGKIIHLPEHAEFHLVVDMPISNVIKHYWDKDGKNNSSNHFCLRTDDGSGFDPWKFMTVRQNSREQKPFVHIFDTPAVDLITSSLRDDEFIEFLKWRFDIFDDTSYSIEFTGENRVLDMYRGLVTIPIPNPKHVFVDDNLGVSGIDQAGNLFGFTAQALRETKLYSRQRNHFMKTGVWKDFKRQRPSKRKKSGKTFGKNKKIRR